jgi:hypothetical protein
MLATEFSRDGVDVLLVERLKTRTFFTKALAVTPRTLGVFCLRRESGEPRRSRK